jgi:hypothetical protein
MGIYAMPRKMTGMVIMIFMILGLISFTSMYMMRKSVYEDIIAALHQERERMESKEQSVAVISDAPLLSYVLKFQYFTDDDWFIPINAISEEEIPHSAMSKELFMIDKSSSRMGTPTERSRIAVNNLRRTDVEEYWYLFTPFEALNTYYYDRDHVLLTVFTNNCDTTQFISFGEGGQIMYTFSDCNFMKHEYPYKKE